MRGFIREFCINTMQGKPRQAYGCFFVQCLRTCLVKNETGKQCEKGILHKNKSIIKQPKLQSTVVPGLNWSHEGARTLRISLCLLALFRHPRVKAQASRPRALKLYRCRKAQ